MNETLLSLNNQVEIVSRDQKIQLEENIEYVPNIKDAKPIISPDKFKFGKEQFYKVANILSEDTIELDTGLKIKLLGIDAIPQESAKILNYLGEFVQGKQVFLKFDPSFKAEEEIVPAYVFLKNKIFINKELVKQKLARVPLYSFKYKDNFIKTIAGT